MGTLYILSVHSSCYYEHRDVKVQVAIVPDHFQSGISNLASSPGPLFKGRESLGTRLSPTMMYSYSNIHTYCDGELESWKTQIATFLIEKLVGYILADSLNSIIATVTID